ncbi:MAG TPA: DUF4245 domain-containing protein [Pseudonocardiaceae bacterium]
MAQTPEKPDNPPPARPGQPKPLPQRSRAQQGVKDILMSMLVLAVIAMGFAGLSRSCSFSPGGPTVDPEVVPTVDPEAELSRAARDVDFPVRHPRLPQGWRANSVTTGRVEMRQDAPRMVRVGWLTDRGRFMKLVQSPAEPAVLVRAEVERDANVLGEVTVDGVRWTAYPGQRQEQSWVTELDGVRILITGSGSEEEFRTLAAAAQQAPVLPGR